MICVAASVRVCRGVLSAVYNEWFVWAFLVLSLRETERERERERERQRQRQTDRQTDRTENRQREQTETERTRAIERRVCANASVYMWFCACVRAYVW